jgi:superfamily II DNA helicase RecQ
MIMRVKHFQIRLTTEYLQSDEDSLNEFLKTVVVKKTTPQLVIVGQTTYWSVLVFYDDISSLENHNNEKTVVDTSTLTEEERTKYEALRAWRNDLARRQEFSSYIIASNAELAAIAKLNPTTVEELHKVKGMGEKKISKYGEEIIGLLHSENTNVV